MKQNGVDAVEISMQRSWLQWVAAGDQWYLSKLGMECCLIYQGEPTLTWVGMPGDILFLFCLKLLWSTGHEQLKPESHKAYTEGCFLRLELGFGIALHVADSAAVHNYSFRLCTVTEACTWQNCICWWDMRVPVTSFWGQQRKQTGNKGIKRMSI